MCEIKDTRETDCTQLHEAMTKLRALRARIKEGDDDELRDIAGEMLALHPVFVGRNDD